MPHLPKWTYGLVAAGSPVAGFPLWQAVLGFHIAAWIAQVPLSLSNVKGCCYSSYFKPLNLAPFSVHWPWCLWRQGTSAPWLLGSGHLHCCFYLQTYLNALLQAFITAPLFVLLEVYIFLQIMMMAEIIFSIWWQQYLCPGALLLWLPQHLLQGVHEGGHTMNMN